MKVRSLAELDDLLDQQLAWRKKEMSTMYSAITLSKGEQKAMLARSGVVLLYAHWEGYAKIALQAYGGYAQSRGLKYSQMKSQFWFHAARSKYQNNIIANPKTVIELLTFERSLLDEVCSFNHVASVDTKANLNGEVLQIELLKLALDGKDFETLYLKLNASLLGKRNKIAHGEREEVSSADFKDLYVVTQELIRRLDLLIRNAACLKSFTYSYGTAHPPQTGHS